MSESELRIKVTEYAKQVDVPDFVHTINELVNQQLWENAAIEEMRATQTIADMWEIVQAVASNQVSQKIIVQAQKLVSKESNYDRAQEKTTHYRRHNSRNESSQ